MSEIAIFVPFWERAQAWRSATARGLVEAARSGKGKSQGKMGSMNVREAREAWLRSPNRVDFGASEDAVRDAFAAGWNAARPTIYGTGNPRPSHNRAKLPGDLEITIWGHTEEGQTIALVLNEAGAVALRDNLTRIGVGL